MNYISIIAALVTAAFLLTGRDYAADHGGQCIASFVENVCALDIKDRTQVLKSIPGIEMRCGEH